jgi:hypothetical protein
MPYKNIIDKKLQVNAKHLKFPITEKGKQDAKQGVKIRKQKGLILAYLTSPAIAEYLSQS